MGIVGIRLSRNNVDISSIGYFGGWDVLLRGYRDQPTAKVRMSPILAPLVVGAVPCDSHGYGGPTNQPCARTGTSQRLAPVVPPEAMVVIRIRHDRLSKIVSNTGSLGG